MEKKNKKLIRLNDVVEMIGLSRCTILNMEADGRFPPKIQLSARAIAWVESDIDEWIEEKKNKKDAG